jgi:hypothetical protein
LLNWPIDTPPTGVAVPNVTVPVDVFPPKTYAGLKLSAVKAGGLMVITADSDAPFKVPVMTAAI